MMTTLTEMRMRKNGVTHKSLVGMENGSALLEK
jgi:hypothetical protein